MARNLLTARQVQVAADGDHGDGDGLHLRIKGGRGSWVYRFTSPSGKRREQGLGVAVRNNITEAGKSLTTARDEAEKARKLLRDKIDPIEHAHEQREAEKRKSEATKAQAKAQHVTLRRFARQFHEAHVEPIRTTKHAAQWINSIEQHVPERLLDAPIDRLQPLQLLDALVPICREVPETGGRVFQRLCTILDAAILEGLRLDNPAMPIKRELARRVGRRERGNFAAMDWRSLPAFIERLRKAEGTAPRCLEWLILTAARTSEALGCEWIEIGTERREWRVPPGRMKLREEHVVYLTDRALEILEQQRGQHDRFVFPSVVGNGKPQSNMALAMCLRRLGEGEVTVHGMRSAFSTWAAETHAATPDVVECALAHKEQDRIRRAYMRGQFLEQRRALMNKWAAYLDGREPASNVFDLELRRVA